MVVRPQAVVRTPAAKTALVAAEPADTQLAVAMRQAEARQEEVHQAEAHRVAVEPVDTRLAAAMHQAEAHWGGKPTAVAMLRVETRQAVVVLVDRRVPVDRRIRVDQARIRVVLQPVVSPAVVATARVATVEQPEKEAHLVALVDRRVLVDRAGKRVAL